MLCNVGTPGICLKILRLSPNNTYTACNNTAALGLGRDEQKRLGHLRKLDVQKACGCGTIKKQIHVLQVRVKPQARNSARLGG